MDFDLFVIGGGSGGVRAGRMAAGKGARVALCESSRMGGTCVNLGCVPKKLMVFAARYRWALEDAAGFGWQIGDAEHSWNHLIQNKDRELDRLNQIYISMLERAGVEVIWGHGVIEGPNRVRVGEQVFTAERILIATGGQPWLPDIPGIELAISSDQAFGLAEIPKRVVLVGGGYISVEFAGIFLGCGAEVSLVHRGGQLLKGFDDDIRKHLGREMEKRGVNLHLGSEALSLERSPNGIDVKLSTGEVLQGDCVLFATGRAPKTGGLFGPDVEVEQTPSGGIVVNDEYQSSLPSVYAVGDVIERAQLTPVALAEGMWLAHHLYGEHQEALNYANIPTAVFTTPPVGTVGLTEEQARSNGHSVAVYRSEFRPMMHTLSGRDERTIMKLVVDSQTDKVLGCHMVGEAAGEIIQGLAVAMTCGATKSQFDATLGIHPTSAEEFVTMREPVNS